MYIPRLDNSHHSNCFWVLHKRKYIVSVLLCLTSFIVYNALWFMEACISKSLSLLTLYVWINSSFIISQHLILSFEFEVLVLERNENYVTNCFIIYQGDAQKSAFWRLRALNVRSTLLLSILTISRAGEIVSNF